MPNHYDDGEYKGSEHATDIFKAPKKKKTPGQELEESGDFLQDPEKEDLSIQQNYADLTIPNAGEEGEQFDAWPNVKQGVNQNILQQGGKWGAAALGTGVTALQKFGEGIDWVGDHILGIPGTDIDLYHARRKIIDPLEKQGLALGILGEILLPDALDVATLGLSYIPSKFLKAGAEGMNLWAKITKQSGKLDTKALDELLAAGKFDEADKWVKANFGQRASIAFHTGFGQNFVPPNPSEIHKVTQKLLNENLIAGNGRFNYNAFRSLLESDRGRAIAELVQTTPHSKIPNWETHRQGLVDVFESIYGDVMQKLDISRSDIDIDHLVTLVQSMPIYDNVKFGSNVWNDITRTMLKRGYKPGRTLDNLNALDPGTHKVKTAFFNNLHGKNGTGFFTRSIMKRIQKNPEERMKVLNRYLDEVDEGKRILEEGQKVWETLYHPGAVLPEQLVESLSKIELNKYSHPHLQKIIKDIIEDESSRIIEGIERGKDLLLERIINPTKKIRVTKKNPLPTQKQIDKSIKDAGGSYQPTLDPGNRDLL